MSAVPPKELSMTARIILRQFIHRNATAVCSSFACASRRGCMVWGNTFTLTSNNHPLNIPRWGNNSWLFCSHVLPGFAIVAENGNNTWWLVTFCQELPSVMPKWRKRDLTVVSSNAENEIIFVFFGSTLLPSFTILLPGFHVLSALLICVYPYSTFVKSRPTFNCKKLQAVAKHVSPNTSLGELD